MNSTDDLFADQGPEYANKPDRLEMVAGKVVATLNQPSATQKRFNALMERIDTEQTWADALRHSVSTHGLAHRQALHEIQSASHKLCRQMTMLLDQRIQAPGKPNGLTPKQKQQATHLVLGLCDQLNPTDDPELEALLARYGQKDDEGMDLRDQAQEFAESVMGADFVGGRAFNSPEEVIRAAIEHAQKKAKAQAEKREAKRAARKAKKGQSGAEVATEQNQWDAHSALRTVYRQLASALHPDREPDEDVRKRKTALMSEVNAAYERKDLSTLLRMQLQAEYVDANKAGALSDAKLKAMCHLLTEQIKALESDNLQLRRGLEFEFGYPAYLRFKESDLLACMLEQRDHLQNDLVQMRADLEAVQDDKGLKAWLKEQARSNKAALRASQVPNFDEMLFAMMRRR